MAKQGVAALIANILDSGADTERVNKALVDSMIVELDKKLSQQMDLLLHAEPLQELRSPPGVHSSWMLVDRTDFRIISDPTAACHQG